MQHPDDAATLNAKWKEMILAERTGGAALLAALLLFFWYPLAAVVPLALFLLLCCVAPFLPGFGFFLPVISRGLPVGANVALSFDDGPSPESTPVLLDLLARHKLPATFFVVGRQAEQYPELIAAILEQGHTIGNHSLRHDYFLMVRSVDTVHQDLRQTQEILAQQGIRPHVFRPPAGITSPRLHAALQREGLYAVNYSCRAWDRGNRNLLDLAAKILRRLRPGDIIMLHDLPPFQPEFAGYWRYELDQLFAALAADFQVVPLEELIGRPVMDREQAGKGLPT
jgi:peptidoglycan/xylan/chitin deacetylase (PgdA/CDA1 family)